jgi:hypothetical protein
MNYCEVGPESGSIFLVALSIVDKPALQGGLRDPAGLKVLPMDWAEKNVHRKRLRYRLRPKIYLNVLSRKKLKRFIPADVRKGSGR